MNKAATARSRTSEPQLASDPWFLFFADCKRIADELRAKRAAGTEQQNQAEPKPKS